MRSFSLPGLPVAILAGEFRLVKATFFQWKTCPPLDGVITFSYHRRGMNQLVLWCLVPLAAIEVAVVHLLIRHWSLRWAWVATDVGALGALYLVGLAKSLRLYPIELTATTLRLRLGVLRERSIDRTAIVSIVTPTPSPQDVKVTRLTLFDPPNLAVRVTTSLGAEQIEFSVDDPAALRQHLMNKTAP